MKVLITTSAIGTANLVMPLLGRKTLRLWTDCDESSVINKINAVHDFIDVSVVSPKFLDALAVCPYDALIAIPDLLLLSWRSIRQWQEEPERQSTNIFPRSDRPALRSSRTRFYISPKLYQNGKAKNDKFDGMPPGIHIYTRHTCWLELVTEALMSAQIFRQVESIHKTNVFIDDPTKRGRSDMIANTFLTWIRPQSLGDDFIEFCWDQLRLWATAQVRGEFPPSSLLSYVPSCCISEIILKFGWKWKVGWDTYYILPNIQVSL